MAVTIKKFTKKMLITTKIFSLLSAATLFHGKVLANLQFIIANPDSGLVLDISGSKCVEGTPIHLWDFHDGPGQWWTLEDNGMIKTAMPGCDMAIDLSGGDCTEGAAIQLLKADPASISEQFILKTRLGVGSIKPKKM